MHTTHSSHEPSSRPTPGTGAKLVGLVGLALTAAAVLQELRRPRAERSWHGRVLGFVPYDFRLPTVPRLRASVWQPEAEEWLLPRSFGVGWSPNLGKLVETLKARRRS